MQRTRRAGIVRSLSVAVVAALALPASAQAHHTAVPIVALDYRNRIDPGGARLAGVHASLADAGRRLRLRVDPGRAVVVLGYLGEPFLRFAPTEVMVADRSPTAQSLGLARPAGTPRSAPTDRAARWAALVSGHELTWADARVWAPASALRNRGTVTWSVPLVVDGRRAQVTGELTRAARPALWPWLVLGLVGLAAAGVAARRRPWPAAIGLALSASAATLAALAGFALAGFALPPERWLLFAAELTLVAGGAAALRRSRLRLAAVSVLAAFAVVQALSELGGVFRHGVVVSALPASAVRATAALGLGCGLGAAALVFVATSPAGAARAPDRFPATSRRRPRHVQRS
ncbi:MAG TPA: hypothetical protein VFA44_12740 [Gaiellaceae bacterium]|nr:hypothetical protein [Gaiellaceae bacterium]